MWTEHEVHQLQGRWGFSFWVLYKNLFQRSAGQGMSCWNGHEASVCEWYAGIGYAAWVLPAMHLVVQKRFWKDESALNEKNELARNSSLWEGKQTNKGVDGEEWRTMPSDVAWRNKVEQGWTNLEELHLPFKKINRNLICRKLVIDSRTTGPFRFDKVSHFQDISNGSWKQAETCEVCSVEKQENDESPKSRKAKQMANVAKQAYVPSWICFEVGLSVLQNTGAEFACGLDCFGTVTIAIVGSFGRFCNDSSHFLTAVAILFDCSECNGFCFAYLPLDSSTTSRQWVHADHANSWLQEWQQSGVVGLLEREGGMNKTFVSCVSSNICLQKHCNQKTYSFHYEAQKAAEIPAASWLGPGLHQSGSTKSRVGNVETSAEVTRNWHKTRWRATPSMHPWNPCAVMRKNRFTTCKASIKPSESNKMNPWRRPCLKHLKTIGNPSKKAAAMTGPKAATQWVENHHETFYDSQKHPECHHKRQFMKPTIQTLSNIQIYKYTTPPWNPRNTKAL